MNASLKTMYNHDIPSRAELPSTRQLIRSTLVAVVSAVVLLYTVVLPAEYGMDPTGIGRVLGLTEMGEIKTRLAREAAEDAAATPPETTSASSPAAQPAPTPGAVWRDEMSFTLAPGQGTEIKLKMKEGEKALYGWRAQGGVVNFDTHGDAPGRSISYEKGRAVASDEGELVAAFTGNHGWFWRNRGSAEVTVVLQTGGDYSDIKRMK
jgi:hypothetical protein